MGSQNEKPKESNRNKSAENVDNLKFLQQNPDKKLPTKTEKLLRYLHDEESAITKKTRDLYERYSQVERKQLAERESNDLEEERLSIKGAIEKREQRLADILGFKKMLVEHANDNSLDTSVDGMIRMYEHGFSGNSRSTVSAEFDVANGQLDDSLDEAQTLYLQELMGHGDKDAFVEAYATNLDRYEEVSEKILSLKKKDRDQNIDVLLSTLNFYESFTTPNFEKVVGDAIEAGAQEVISNQEKYFKGLRGFIQRHVELGGKAVVNFLATPEDQNESIARSILIKSVQMSVDIIRPIKYDKAVIDAVKQETIAQVISLRDAVDIKAVRTLREACINLKSNPDDYLQSDDTREFKKAFSEYLPTTVDLVRRHVAVEQELINDAYILSQGESNSQFKSDSTLRAKALQSKEGVDFIRSLRLYAPFGILMPTEVDLKDGSVMHLKSPYTVGYFEEHPLIGIAVQDAEVAATVAVASKLAPWGAKLSKWMLEKAIGKTTVKVLLAPPKIAAKSMTWALTKVVGKGLAKSLTGAATIGPAGTIYGIVDTGNEIREYLDDADEAEVLNKIMSFRAQGETIPANESEKIRQQILVTEIKRLRGWFQSPGRELGNTIDSTWDRWNIDNLGEANDDTLHIRKTMRETGELRTAFLNANRKLVLLGFEPFTMP